MVSLRTRELDLAPEDAHTRLALDAEAVVLARDRGGGEIDVGAALGVGAERAGADLVAVVADAPQLVHRVGRAAEAADTEVHIGAGVEHRRSEERRVGKGWRSLGSRADEGSGQRRTGEP